MGPNPLEHSAVYFPKAQQITAGLGVRGKMQVFQKNDAILVGIDEAVEFIKANAYGPVKITALKDGMRIKPWETVMTIDGDVSDFLHLESIYLGIMARGTKVATNMRKVVDAANGKPIFFMGDRFDRYENQEADGYAAVLGGATDICTPAMGKRLGLPGKGTMPHALIAAFGGDVVAACKAYRDKFPDQPLSALVDFNNDCTVDAARCAKEFGKDLYSVRLDTSENMVDQAIAHLIVNRPDLVGDFKPTGVNTALVQGVRVALDRYGAPQAKIVVSGGFDPDKIKMFEDAGAPVDMYGVGSSILKGSNDFTADLVEPVAKAGRHERPNPRLVEV